MDQIRQLDSFVAAVEAGSFVKAADALNTSKAVISKHVLGLEQRLGVRLLNRTTPPAVAHRRRQDVFRAREADPRVARGRGHGGGVERVATHGNAATHRIAYVRSSL